MGCKTCGHHSVTSAHVDLAIDNNVTWSDAFQFGTPGDTSWSFTNMTFTLEVKRSRYDASPLLSISSSVVSTTGYIAIDDPIQRALHVTVPYTTIRADLTNGEYVYDLVMADNSSPPVRTALMHGKLCVGQGVTV